MYMMEDAFSKSISLLAEAEHYYFVREKLILKFSFCVH